MEAHEAAQILGLFERLEPFVEGLVLFSSLSTLAWGAREKETTV